MNCPKKPFLTLFLSGLLLLFPQFAHADFVSTPDGGTVVANNTIYAFVLSPNGSTLYIGGAFTSLGGQTRNRLAAISTSNGAVTSFDPNVSTAGSSVRSLAISPDGSKLYIGGSFATIAGAARARLAAVNTSDGTIVSAFDPNAQNLSYALTLSSDGSVLYAGGAFTTIGGTARNRLAAINTADGTLVSAFNPNAGGSVQSLVLSSDGSKLYAGGAFTTIGGVTYNHLAAINTSDGTAIPAFNPNVDGGVCAITALTLSSSGAKIYAGGSCTTIGGATYNYLGAINTSDGTAIPAFNPNADSGVSTLVLSSDGSKLYAGGNFATIAGATYNKLVIINTSDGTAVSAFNPNVNSTVLALALSSNGSKLYAGGVFTAVGGDSAFAYFASFTNVTSTPTPTSTSTPGPTSTQVPGPTSTPTAAAAISVPTSTSTPAPIFMPLPSNTPTQAVPTISPKPPLFDVVSEPVLQKQQSIIPFIIFMVFIIVLIILLILFLRNRNKLKDINKRL